MLFDSAFLKNTARKLARRTAPAPVPDAVIERHLSLPICSPTAEESGAAAVFESARNLARQGDWADVAALIGLHDRARDMIADGTPLAELISAGARADLVTAMQTAARQGVLTERHMACHALEDFCADLADPALGYGAAILAAEALMDAGWSWYEQGVMAGQKDRHLPQFTDLFERARARLAPYSALEENAPALAAANCALLAGLTDAAGRVSDDYEDLIDLNPRAPGHLRAFGLHMLPQWFGTHATLEVQARRAAVQTADVWGAGGYTWVWLDALALDPSGFAYLDMDFFLDGMDDILSRRSGQYFVNLFAAYLTRYIDTDEGGPDRGQRRALSRRRAALVRGRMEELHPWVWALGPLSGASRRSIDTGTAPRAHERGREMARLALADIFARELAATRVDPA